MPVQTIFENLEAGLSVKEITEVFDVTGQEVGAVMQFVSQRSVLHEASLCPPDRLA